VFAEEWGLRLFFPSSSCRSLKYGSAARRRSRLAFFRLVNKTGSLSPLIFSLFPNSQGIERKRLSFEPDQGIAIAHYLLPPPPARLLRAMRGLFLFFFLPCARPPPSLDGRSENCHSHLQCFPPFQERRTLPPSFEHAEEIRTWKYWPPQSRNAPSVFLQNWHFFLPLPPAKIPRV